jgi:hypothetical protein
MICSAPCRFLPIALLLPQPGVSIIHAGPV